MLQVSRGRGTVAAALAIVMLLVVVGTALAVLSTLNINMAATEEYDQKALDLARAGIDQFLADVEKGFLDPVLSPGQSALEQVLSKGFTLHQDVDPNAVARRAALTDPSVPPYPLPRSHLSGLVYITFAAANTQGLPYSTWNATSDTPVSGWHGRIAPAFSIDLIATSHVGRYTKRLAVRVTRRWDYAIACAQQIFLATHDGYPTQVTGDVYTRNLPLDPNMIVHVHLGFDLDPSKPDFIGPATPGTTVRGRLIDTSPDPKSIAESPGNVSLGKRINYKLVRFPRLASVPVDGTWTDLSQYTETRPYPDGTYLKLLMRHNRPVSPPVYLLENVNPAAPGTPLTLTNGRFLVPGNLSIRETSNCSGLRLESSVLRVEGNFAFVDRPTAIVGIKSVLSVKDNLYFRWGFLQSDQDGGFVVRADRLVSEVGGDFRGVTVVDKGVWLGALDLNDLTGVPIVRGGGSVPVSLGDLLAQCGGGGCGNGNGNGNGNGCGNGTGCGCGNGTTCGTGPCGCGCGCGNGNGCGNGTTCGTGPCSCGAGCRATCGMTCGQCCCTMSCPLGPCCCYQAPPCCCMGPACCCCCVGPTCCCYGHGHSCNGSNCMPMCCPHGGSVCTGPYYLGGGPALPPFGPPPVGHTAAVTATSIAAVRPADAPALAAGAPVYPLVIRGALLAPYEADATQSYPLVVRSVAVTWDPDYLMVLHRQAPLSTEAWEALP